VEIIVVGKNRKYEVLEKFVTTDITYVIYRTKKEKKIQRLEIDKKQPP
jgi:hypothetical protein